MVRQASPALTVASEQREVLVSLAKSGSAPHRHVIRAQALLLAAEGVASTGIAMRLKISPSSVARWRERLADDGVAKFGEIRKGRGRKPSIPAEKVEAIVEATVRGTPQGETHWSCRTMAKGRG